MGLYKYIRESWRAPGTSQKERLMQFRRELVSVRIDYPTRLDRARSLGYKAKKGFILVRERVSRSRRMRPHGRGGRRPRASRTKLVLDLNYQQLAERRANDKFKNLEVLGSYEVANDGKHYWFEVILVDPKAPEIKSDRRINWICNPEHHNRVFRGLTSAGRKSRGLRNKGKGAEKFRPSKPAAYRRKVN